MVLPAFRPIRPDDADIDRFPLSNNFQQVYTRDLDTVAAIVLENESGLQMRYHFKKGKPQGGKYRTLDAGDTVVIEADIKMIYAATSAPADPPVDLVVTRYYYTQVRMQEIAAKEVPEDYRAAIAETVRSMMQTEVRTRLLTEITSVFEAIRDVILRRGP